MSSQSPPIDDLQHVVCPVCHHKLYRERNVIACKGCGREYPVVKEIPVLIADRAL